MTCFWSKSSHFSRVSFACNFSAHVNDTHLFVALNDDWIEETVSFKMSQDFLRQVVVTTFTSVICPRCTEKANYLDSAHDNGVDSIGSIHDEMKAARLLFLGTCELMLSETSFLLDPTTTSSNNFNFEPPLLVIRVPVERCTVQEKWCYAYRFYDIEIKSFAENDRRRPTRSQTYGPMSVNGAQKLENTLQLACLHVERHLKKALGHQKCLWTFAMRSRRFCLAA